jgi:cyanophycinase
MGRTLSTQTYAFLLFAALALVQPPLIPARYLHRNAVPQGEASNHSAPTLGPEKGWLIIHGGGTVSGEIKKRFVALAGGPDANFVLIPTAMSEEEITAGGFYRGQGSGWAKSMGINHVTMLHARDKARANSEYFIDTLRKASGVWIMGGRQWRLANAYLDTAVEREIKELLARGGVVGGGSAGATIQGSYLVRGDPKSNEIMMSPGHERGFGLLSNSAIDQHVNTREREHDLVKVIEKHPELLGFGINEGAAMVVHGDALKVIGGQVAIYDGKEHDGALYHFLSPEQTFNLKTRVGEHVAESRPASTSSVATGKTQDGKKNMYPLTLTVTSAQRFTGQGGTKTSGAGLLASKDDPNAAPEHIIIECDTGVFSRAGNNIYPARISKPHQLKIAAREIGSDKVHESTCKY